MRKRDLAVFLLYVALAGSGWMLEFLSPSPPAPIYPESIALTAVLVCFGFRTPVRGVSRTRVLRALLSGLLLFGLPRVLSASLVHGLPQPTRVVFLALVPVVIVLVQSFREPDTDFLRLLAASLVGVAGLVLVVPTDFAVVLREPASAILFGIVIVSTASGGYLGYGAARALPRKVSAVLMLLPGLLCSCIQAGLAHATIHLSNAAGLLSAALAGIQMGLIVFLIGSVPPVAFSTRYLLIPLTAAIEGLVYLRPAVTWRLTAGLLALLFGAVKLLVREEHRPDSSRSLL